MENRQSTEDRNSNPRSNNNGGKFGTNNEYLIKMLLICYLVILLLHRHFGDGYRSDTMPDIFLLFPSVYYGIQVLLATGMFTAFLGLLSPNGSIGQRFSRFCALYSSICLAFLVILLLVPALLPKSDIPFWLRSQIYAAAISLTSPFPFFLLLALLLPVALHFALSRCR